MKAVPQQNQGAALATYTVFMDMSLGITGPLAGLVMAWAGVPADLSCRSGSGDNCLVTDVAAKKMAPGASTGGHVIIVKVTGSRWC